MDFLQAQVASTPFVLPTSFSYEERPPFAGIVRGIISFIDGSQLDFKEFLFIQPDLNAIKFAYNYRTVGQIIFRCDNANDPAAKNLPTFPAHKHVQSGIIEAKKPTLEQVLKEITSQIKFL